MKGLSCLQEIRATSKDPYTNHDAGFRYYFDDMYMTNEPFWAVQKHAETDCSSLQSPFSHLRHASKEGIGAHSEHFPNVFCDLKKRCHGNKIDVVELSTLSKTFSWKEKEREVETLEVVELLCPLSSG